MLNLNNSIKVDENWRQINGKYKCPICNKEYTKKGISTHIYRAHTNRKFSSGYNGYYDNIEYRKKISRLKISTNEKRLGLYKWFEVKCNKCNVSFCVKEREKSFPEKEKYFCCLSCAMSRDMKGCREKWSEQKKAIFAENARLSSLKLWEDEEYRNKVLNATNNIFTSKGEKEVRNYFMGKYPNDDWTFGGLLKHNSLRLVRDLYSKKLKTCVEYDGIWHFKDIKGQLKDKKEKDKCLESWCIKNEYRLIRIDEDLYNKNKEYWINILEYEIYNGTNQIVKFGDKYK